MKILFLENLLICKKMSSDESIKENFNVSQTNENRAIAVTRQENQPLKNSVSFVSTQRNTQLLKPTTVDVISPRLVNHTTTTAPVATELGGEGRYVSFQLDKSGEPPKKVHFRSILQKPSLTPPCYRESMTTVSGSKSTRTSLTSCLLSKRLQSKMSGYVASFLETLSQDDEDDVKLMETSPTQGSKAVPGTLTPLQQSQSLKSNTSVNIPSIWGTQKQETGSAIVATAAASAIDGDEVKILEAPSRMASLTQELSLRSCQAPTTSNKCSGVKNQVQSAEKSPYENVSSKNRVSSTILSCGKTPRIRRRRKQTLVSSSCVDISEPESGTEASDDENSSKTSDLPKVDNSCSSPKKQKISPETATNCYLQNTSVSSKQKDESQGKVYTIVLSDSSEDEFNEEALCELSLQKDKKKKTVPSIRRSARKKARAQVASKTALLKSKKSVCSSGPNNIHSKPKTMMAAKEGSKKRNSSQNGCSRNVGIRKAVESKNLRNNSESPKYVSRSGRSSFSSGCRSCPGCSIDTRHKEKPKLTLARKESKPVPKSRTPEPPSIAVIEGLTSSDSDDELTGMLKGGRAALVVVPDDSDDEESVVSLPLYSIDEVTEKSHLHSLVSEEAASPTPESASILNHITFTTNGQILEPAENHAVGDNAPPEHFETSRQARLFSDASSTAVQDSMTAAQTGAGIKLYMSHHDSNDRHELEEIDSKSSSSSSDDLENLDSQDYSDCQSSCSSDANIAPLVQEVSVSPDNQANCSHSVDLHSVEVGHKHLNFRQLPENNSEMRETYFKDSEQLQKVLESLETTSEHSIDRNAAQEEKCDGSRKIQEDLGSEHGNASLEDSSLSLPLDGAVQLQQDKGASAVDIPEKGGLIDQDQAYSFEPKDVLRDSSAPLSEFTSQTFCSSSRDQLIPLEVCPQFQINKYQAHDGHMNDVVATPSDVVGCSAEALVEGINKEAIPEVLPIKDSNLTCDPKCNPKTSLQDNLDELDPKTGIDLAESSEKSDNGQDLIASECNHEVLEIHVLEGCSFCKDEDKSTDGSFSTFSKFSSSDERIPVKPVCSPGESSSNGHALTQGESFYHTISKLMVDCLNSMVESVKFDNREVIIKKANPETEGYSTGVVSESREDELPSEDVTSIVKELNLTVAVNPLLTIKKLPFTPSEHNSDIVVSCQNTSSLESSSNLEGKYEVHQVPEKSGFNQNIPPDVSLYERKGYPSPIKRLNPKVLSIIKYNDLDIYSDEPSLNDRPRSDRVVCVSSSGLRLELNPEELFNLERFLISKTPHVGDAVRSKAPVTDHRLDDLVIYNDEPSFNLTHIKPPPSLVENEDLADLLIDNDDPPLNEPAEVSAGDKHCSKDTDCMIISSDDEVPMTSAPLKEASRPGGIVDITPRITPLFLDKHHVQTRKKLIKKRQKPRNSVNLPSIAELQRSQMELRGDILQEQNQPIWDIGELEVADEFISEVVIENNDVGFIDQPTSGHSLPIQSCREVLHQPHVYNHEGQPLRLETGDPGDPVRATYSQRTLSALPNSRVAPSLSETFDDPPHTEIISDSDTLTSSECEDIIVDSPPKSQSHVDKLISTYGNKSVFQSVDADSDDDVIMLSEVPSVGNRSCNPAPMQPPVLAPRDLLIPPRNSVPLQLNPRSLLSRDLARPNLAGLLNSPQIKSIRTSTGNSYYLVVVPPNKANPSR